jgi:hypothetical protein
VQEKSTRFHGQVVLMTGATTRLFLSAPTKMALMLDQLESNLSA